MRVQIFGLGVDIEQAGHDLAFGVMLLQVVHRADAIVRIVVRRAACEAKTEPSCCVTILHRTRRVVGRDFRAGRDEVETVDRLIVLAHES